MSDPFDLQRFVSAQDESYAQALDEIRRGRKQSHWMWFVFPQIEGLGSSPTARHYAIRSRGEAKAYLAHPVLGPRLREITKVAAALTQGSARSVFGTPDDMKLRSSLTLFREVAEGEDRDLFTQALNRFFDAKADEETLRRL